MYIDLKWQNLNTAPTVLKIYRGVTPVDRDNLGTPIVTLENGEETYRDNGVVLGATYYYVFETITSGDRHVSANYEVVAINNRGPGPQNLLDGDYKLGYLGTVGSNRLLSARQLYEAVGLINEADQAVLGTITNPYPVWHKYIRNNKMIYVPDAALGFGITWNKLYDMGLVYGDRGQTTNPFKTGVDQNKRITVGFDEYIVRLMTGCTDSVYEVLPDQNTEDNEIDDFIYPMAHIVPHRQRLDNHTRNGKYMADLKTTAQVGYGVWVQELATATNGLIRLGSVSESTERSSPSETPYTQRLTYGPTSVNAFYWPVLELVEV